MSSIKEKPRITSRNVEQLFKSLSSRHELSERVKAYREYLRLDKECDDHRDKLLSDKKLKTLERARDKARRDYEKSSEEFRRKVNLVRQRYWVNGLTEGIVKELNKLLNEVETL